MRSKKINQFGEPVEKTKLYDFDAIRKARQIIEKDPSDHKILSRLALEAGINERKLKTGFRELFETSPYKYLVSLRLEMAKTLLEDTDDTVRQIAYKVGFESCNGFRIAFKNTFGLSPRQFRKECGDISCVDLVIA
jgi:AraC-like DNA-binding protein